ncbi:MAG: hypothetical protein A2381_10260 [Bdellovibrionales bacterium RIFOXYB1_FULL_37_110]|nr:MAG: hypothetical protein A2417_02775 [Bdellovibrionales bacterium RIFOXYC1_FULL_37_79]OFZ61147.1 MAG: hypothetical protein A2381_10260 [Bdellovibrionales bacterium RIFOXYB1_FULL_37_110]OFZ65598.1 MAG: hypothetical protein A2577_02445 [Bdellovibrionales bacterium RIFOXYD1_FULL_36_51]
MKPINVKPIKMIKSCVRVATTYTVLLSLIIYPMEIFSLDGDTTRTIGGIINQFGQQMQRLQSMQYDNQAQMASLARAQQLIAASAPSTVISSRYFPGCALPPDNQLPPPNVCENLQTQADIILAQQMTYLGQQQTIFLDIMLNGTGDSSPNNAGIACMEEALNRHAQLFTSKVNSLEGYRTKYNKEKQILKKNLQPLLDKMGDLHYEVAGGDPKNAKQKSVNLAKLFTGTACQGIVDDAHYINKKGIRGVRDALTTPTEGSNGKSLYGNASNILSDKDKLKAQVEIQIERLVKHVNTYGPGEFDIKDGYLDRGGETAFYEMGLAVVRQQEILTKRHKQIKDQLAKDFPGYELPPLDRHFYTNIDRFAEEAADYFRKKMVHDCVTMKDTTGVGLTNDQVISMLSSPRLSNGYVTVESYKAKLKAILDQPSFIEDKLNAIKELDKAVGLDVEMAGKFSFLPANSPKSPYVVYKALVDMCTKSRGPLEGTNAFSAKSGARDARSGMEKVEEGKRLVAEIKQLGARFTSDLAKEIRERTLSCGGGITQTSASCNTKTLTPQEKGFCLDNAVKCATRVKSCQALTQKHIEDRVTQIKQIAGTYNQNVLAFTAETERSLNVLKTQVFQDMATFAAQFSEVNIPLPEDLFVKLPESIMSPYDVDLLGSVVGRDKFSFMDDLSDNIGKLIGTIQGVNNDIQKIGQPGGYVEKTKKKLKENQRKWDDFRTLCSDKIAEIQMNQKQMQEDAMRKQQEQQKQMLEELNDKELYCTKYHSLNRSHPGPGCDQEIQSLIDGFDDVAIALRAESDQILFNLNSYKVICDKINNEERSDEEEKIRQISLPKLCFKTNYNFEALKKSLIKDLISQAPESISQDEILDYLSDVMAEPDEKKADKPEKGEAGKGGKTKDKTKKLFASFKKIKDKNSDDDDEDIDDFLSTGEHYFDQKLKGLKQFLKQAQNYSNNPKSMSSVQFHTDEINNFGVAEEISNAKIEEDLKALQKLIDHLAYSEDKTLTELKLERQAINAKIKRVEPISADTITSPTEAAATVEASKKELQIVQDKIIKHLGHTPDWSTFDQNAAPASQRDQKIKTLMKEAMDESKDIDKGKLDTKLNSIAKALENDDLNPEIHEAAKALAANVKKRKDNKPSLDDQKEAKEKFVEELNKEETDACAILQREIVVDLAKTCLKKEKEPLSCYKEKEQEAFLDGDGESLASRNLSYQLQEYMKLPLDSPYSEKWEGMGELLDGTCNSENDMQRGYWGDSQRNNDPFEQMNQWAAPIQGR